jgi:hypothetical protein
MVLNDDSGINARSINKDGEEIRNNENDWEDKQFLPVFVEMFQRRKDQHGKAYQPKIETGTGFIYYDIQVCEIITLVRGINGGRAGQKSNQLTDRFQ